MFNIPTNNLFGKDSISTQIYQNYGICILQLPIQQNMSFEQRLNNVRDQLNRVVNTPEVLITYYLIQCLSRLCDWSVVQLIWKLMRWILFWRKKNWISMTIVNHSESECIQICDCNVTDICTIMQTPRGVGVGFCMNNYNGEFALSVTMNKSIYGENGTKLMMTFIKQSFQEQGCFR